VAYKAVASAGNGLDKSRLFGIIFQCLADFPDCRIDCAIGIEEDVLAPELFDDRFASYQLAPPLDQQEQDFHRDSFEL
jgi:hypothetical protein